MSKAPAAAPTPFDGRLDAGVPQREGRREAGYPRADDRDLSASRRVSAGPSSVTATVNAIR